MISDISHILHRAAVIRLTPPELAREAGVAVSTVRRLSKRGSGYTGTLVKLESALIRQERQLLNHLKEIHEVAA
jgi:DNA-binding MurR/RpiR family transcriptional regulator